MSFFLNQIINYKIIYKLVYSSYINYIEIKLYKSHKKNFKDGDRVNAQMTSMVASLNEQDMNDLAIYFENQKNNQGFAKPDLVNLGQKIYRAGDSETGIAACMACHGPAGSGNPAAMYPSLRGQHAEYTIMQLKMFKTQERNNDSNAVMRSIANRMTDTQIKAVSEYIQGLRLR